MYPSSHRGVALLSALAVTVSVLTACKGTSVPDGGPTTSASPSPIPSPSPTTLGPDQLAVNAYVDSLAPLHAEPASDSPIGPATQTVSEPSPDTDQPSGQVRYQCTVTPYSLKADPDKIVVLNPDSAKLWPGALLQGQGYAGGLGSLKDLPVSSRAPLTIFTDLMGSEVATTIAHPDGATVAQAVSNLVAKAKAAQVSVPAHVSFDQKEAHSSQEALLKLGISAKFLGVTATGKLDTSHSEKQSSVIASFYQRMFTVSIVKAASPANYFDNSFSTADLEQMQSAHIMGPDNPPVVVSSISYGRILLFSITGNTTSDKLQAAVDVAYSNGANSGSVQVDAQTQSILDTAHVSVVALGGTESSALSLIKDHKLGDYFGAATDLATAVPISYQVDNVSDGSTAAFNETTDYNLTQCAARPNTATTVGTIVKVSNLRFVPACGGQFFGSLSVDGSQAWSEDWQHRVAVDPHADLKASPNGAFKGAPVDPVFKVQPGPAEFAVTADRPLQVVGSLSKFVYWPDTPPLNKWEGGGNSLTWPLTFGDHEMAPAASSAHCPATLKFTLDKVTDLQTWAP